MNDNDMPHGIYPMLYAFFNAQGGLDRHATRRQVQAFVDNGAHGMAVLGLGTEALYREVLPTIVFVTQSLDTLHTYGKRIAAMRLGLGEVFDRTPALRPNAFGMRCAQRYAAALGPLK